MKGVPPNETGCRHGRETLEMKEMKVLAHIRDDCNPHAMRRVQTRADAPASQEVLWKWHFLVRL